MRKKTITAALTASALTLGLTAATITAAPEPAHAAIVYCDNVTQTGWTPSPLYRIPSKNYSFNCNLKPSTTYNTAVVALQRSLLTCYPSKIPTAWRSSFVDGYYGAKTTQVLKNVQAAIGTTADGLYGPNTRNKMSWATYNSSGAIIGCQKPPTILISH